MNLRQRWVHVLMPGVLMMGVVLGSSDGGAQARQADQAFTAYLHAGTCERFDPQTVVAESEATREAGAPESFQSLSFAMETDLDIAALRAEPHAITVEGMDADVATVVACGEIVTGAEATRLVIPVTATNAAVPAGMAVVSAADDGSTRVVLFMSVATSGTGAGAAETPAVDAEDDDAPADDDDSDPEGGV